MSYSVRRRHLDRDLRAESIRFRGAVLEIGCGRLGRRGVFRPPTEGVLRWLYVDRDLARAPHVCGDATRLPIRSSVFDTVVCLEVLEYVWRPDAALTEMRRLLKPGGTLVLSTPFLHRIDASNDYWRFTEPALRRLLEAAGFEVIQWAAQGNALAVASSVLRNIVNAQRVALARALNLVFRPIFGALEWADSSMAKRHPILGTFTTGYLVIARRPALARG
jgi:SAM-dependent methyltransferase